MVPSIGWQIVAALATYLLVSILKVNLGSSYPSDCVIAVLPILIIIAANYGINWIVNNVSSCENCGEAVCYAINNRSNQITRTNFYSVA